MKAWLAALSPVQRQFFDAFDWQRRWDQPTDDLERVTLPPDAPIPPIDHNLLALLATLPGVTWDLDLTHRLNTRSPCATPFERTALTLLWARTNTSDPPVYETDATIYSFLISAMPRRELHTILQLKICTTCETPVWVPVSRTLPLCRLALHLAAELPERDSHPAWQSLLAALKLELEEHGMHHWVFMRLHLMNTIPPDLWEMCVTTIMAGLDQVQELIESDYLPSLKALLRHTPTQSTLAFAWMTRMLSLRRCCGAVALPLLTRLMQQEEDLDVRQDVETLVALLRNSPLDAGLEVDSTMHRPFIDFLFRPSAPPKRIDTIQLCRRYPHLIHLWVVARALNLSCEFTTVNAPLQFSMVEGRECVSAHGVNLALPPGDSHLRLVISLPGQAVTVRTQTQVRTLHSYVIRTEFHTYVSVHDFPDFMLPRMEDCRVSFRGWLSSLALPPVAMRTVAPMLFQSVPPDARALHEHMVHAHDPLTLQDQWMPHIRTHVFGRLFFDGDAMEVLFRIAKWIPNHVSPYVVERARAVFQRRSADAFWETLEATPDTSVWCFMADMWRHTHSSPWDQVPEALKPRWEVALACTPEYFKRHCDELVLYIHSALQQQTLPPTEPGTLVRRLALHTVLTHAFTPLERLRWAELVASSEVDWLQAPVQADVERWRQRWRAEEASGQWKSTAADWYLTSYADLYLCRDPESLPCEFRPLAKRTLPLEDMSLEMLRHLARRPWDEVCEELASFTPIEEAPASEILPPSSCPICCEATSEMVECTHHHVACVTCVESFALAWSVDEQERCMETGYDGLYHGTARHPTLHRILRRHLIQQIRLASGYLEAEPTPGQIQAFLDGGGFYLYPRAPTPDAEARSCPGGCRHDIVRTEGCLHMTCPHCRYEFCWGCMGPFHTHFACGIDPERVTALRELHFAMRQVQNRPLSRVSAEVREDMFRRAEQLVTDPSAPLPLLPYHRVRCLQMDLILHRWTPQQLRNLLRTLKSEGS